MKDQARTTKWKLTTMVLSVSNGQRGGGSRPINRTFSVLKALPRPMALAGAKGFLPRQHLSVDVGQDPLAQGHKKTEVFGDFGHGPMPHSVVVIRRVCIYKIKYSYLLIHTLEGYVSEHSQSDLCHRWMYTRIYERRVNTQTCLYITSIVPVLTPQFHSRNALKNNHFQPNNNIFSIVFSLIQLYMPIHTIRNILIHKKE